MVRFLQGNLKRRRDNWIAIEGPEGAGKTTDGMNLALDLKPTFSVEHDAIFTVNHLLDVLAQGRKGELYFLDEGANIFYNRDWNTWESKELTKLGRQMRIMRSTWIVIMPDFSGLDPYVRDKRIRLRIFQPPYFDADGMTNGPAKVLWRSAERFDYTEQEVQSRWVDVFDMGTPGQGEAAGPVPSLEGHPEWKAYEARKEVNFQGLVSSMKDRMAREARREEKRLADAPRPKPRGKDRHAPPTTT